MSLTQRLRALFGTGRDEQSRALDGQQTDEDERSTVGNLKREFAEHPSKGLTPAKLHHILEAAEQGDLKPCALKPCRHRGGSTFVAAVA